MAAGSCPGAFEARPGQGLRPRRALPDHDGGPALLAGVQVSPPRASRPPGARPAYSIPQNLDLLSKDFHHPKRKLTSFLSPDTAPDNFIFKTKIRGRTRAHIFVFKIKLRARQIRSFGRLRRPNERIFRASSFILKKAVVRARSFIFPPEQADFESP